MAAPTSTYYRSAQLVPLFQRMLALCKLKKEESIVIVSDPDSNQEYAAAMFAAARSFESDVISLVLPSPPAEQANFIRTGNISSTIVANSKLALDYLKMADFVIDMTSVGLLHTKEQVAVLEYKIVPPTVLQKAEASLAVIGPTPSPATCKTQKAACDYINRGAYDASGPVVYSGKDLKGAQASYGQGGAPDILFQTKNPKKFLALTTPNIGKPLGIFLDKRYVSAPTLQGPIADDVVGADAQQLAMAEAARSPGNSRSIKPPRLRTSLTRAPCPLPLRSSKTKRSARRSARSI